MHKTLLLAAALGAAMIFVQPAAAQHRHGGHGHGHHHHHHGHYHGGFGGSFGHFHYYPSYVYGGGYYNSPFYSYSSPSYYAYPPITPQYSYGSPAPNAPLDPAPLADPTTANQAQIQVVLPNPDAEVTFDGMRTGSVGRVRLYHTPALDSSRSSSYRIGVSWIQDGRPVTDARMVTVTPGRTTVVDFTQPATESVPLPK